MPLVQTDTAVEGNEDTKANFEAVQRMASGSGVDGMSGIIREMEQEALIIDATKDRISSVSVSVESAWSDDDEDLTSPASCDYTPRGRLNEQTGTGRKRTGSRSSSLSITSPTESRAHQTTDLTSKDEDESKGVPAEQPSTSAEGMITKEEEMRTTTENINNQES